MDSSLSTQLAVSGSPYTDSATNTAALKETDSSATISAIATKLVDELKGSSNTISRPASTSSRNSVQSVTDTQSMQRKQADSQDSLSSMPTPRNTFLCPPTGINISYKGSLQSSSTSVTATSSPMPNWDSLQHQKQLQQLLEEKGLPQESTAGDDARTARMSFPASQWPIKASFDDSYCLLSAPKDLADGPTRPQMLPLLRRPRRPTCGIARWTIWVQVRLSRASGCLLLTRARWRMIPSTIAHLLVHAHHPMRRWPRVLRRKHAAAFWSRRSPARLGSPTCLAFRSMTARPRGSPILKGSRSSRTCMAWCLMMTCFLPRTRSR
ncbi:hypothetical protein GQ54DRAFT_1649 [Martensiomyces pterosporus]|nr:hypothetical protein GQ54DRAFT_1649 [Martensiomyces pterosporus]